MMEYPWLLFISPSFSLSSNGIIFPTSEYFVPPPYRTIYDGLATITDGFKPLLYDIKKIVMVLPRAATKCVAVMGTGPSDKYCYQINKTIPTPPGTHIGHTKNKNDIENFSLKLNGTCIQFLIYN